MANTQDVPFVKKFGQEVHHKFAQTESLLLNSVSTLRGIEGSSYRWQVVGQVEANTKARNADVTPLEIAHTFVDITLSDFYAPLYFDKLDQLKTNVSFREMYVKETAGAINRKIDDTIIAALAAASGTTTVTAGGVWTYAKHMEAIEALMTKEANDGDRTLVIAPRTYTAMLSDVKLTSGDYQSLKPVETGKLGTLFGANVILSNRLPLATTARTNFYFNKSAVCAVLGLDPHTDVDWIAEKVAWLVNTMTSVGSAALEGAGIVKFVTTEV